MARYSGVYLGRGSVIICLSPWELFGSAVLALLSSLCCISAFQLGPIELSRVFTWGEGKGKTIYMCRFLIWQIGSSPSKVSNWGKEIMDSVLTLRLIAAIFVVIGVVLMFFETGLAIEQ